MPDQFFQISIDNFGRPNFNFGRDFNKFPEAWFFCLLRNLELRSRVFNFRSTECQLWLTLFFISRKSFVILFGFQQTLADRILTLVETLVDWTLASVVVSLFFQWAVLSSVSLRLCLLQFRSKIELQLRSLLHYSSNEQHFVFYSLAVLHQPSVDKFGLSNLWQQQFRHCFFSSSSR